MSEQSRSIDPRYTKPRNDMKNAGAETEDSQVVVRPKFPTIRRPFTESDVADQHRMEKRRWN